MHNKVGFCIDFQMLVFELENVQYFCSLHSVSVNKPSNFRPESTDFNSTSWFLFVTKRVSFKGQNFKLLCYFYLTSPFIVKGLLVFSKIKMFKSGKETGNAWQLIALINTLKGIEFQSSPVYTVKASQFHGNSIEKKEMY